MALPALFLLSIILMSLYFMLIELILFFASFSKPNWLNSSMSSLKSDSVITGDVRYSRLLKSLAAGLLNKVFLSLLLFMFFMWITSMILLGCLCLFRTCSFRSFEYAESNWFESCETSYFHVFSLLRNGAPTSAQLLSVSILFREFEAEFIWLLLLSIRLFISEKYL